MKIPFFGDIGKSNKLFDAKEYDLNRTIQFTKKTDYGKLKSKTVLDAKKLKNKVTFTKTVNKVGDIELVTTGSDLSCEVTNKNLVPNCTLSGKAGCNNEQESTLEYTSDNRVGKLEFSSSSKGELEGTVSGTVGYEGVSVGVELKLAPGDQMDLANMVSDYNAGVNWVVDDSSTYSIKTSNRCDTVQATFWKQFSEQGQIAARLNYDMVMVGQRSVEVAGSVGYGQATVGGYLDGDGMARFIYKRPISSTVKGQLATSYNLLSGGAWNTSWKLEFQA